jgi:hypothetical protein
MTNNNNGKKLKLKNLEPYQHHLVDQLEEGWISGFAFTAITGGRTHGHIKLLLQIADYPGMAELNHQTSHSGAYGQLSFYCGLMFIFFLYQRLHQMLYSR